MVTEMADVESGKNGAADYAAANRTGGFMDDDDSQAQMQGSNLSMDEVRRSLDEFEQILRT